MVHPRRKLKLAVIQTFTRKIILIYIISIYIYIKERERTPVDSKVMCWNMWHTDSLVIYIISMATWPKMVPNLQGITVDHEFEMLRQRFSLRIRFQVVTISNTCCCRMEWVAFFSALSVFLAFYLDASSSTGGLPGS